MQVHFRIDAMASSTRQITESRFAQLRPRDNNAVRRTGIASGQVHYQLDRYALAALN